MRILLLAPYFYPYQNPRAHRWTAIARQWAANGWEVHAVCSRHPGRYEGRAWEGIHLHPAGFNSVKEAAYNWFPSLPKRGEQPKPGKLSYLMSLLNDLALKTWYWPDDAWLWIAPARKMALQLLETANFDAMVSVSLPFSAHWAALSVKKLHPGLKWLADTGDPFVQQDHPLNNVRLYARKNLLAEIAVLQSASRVAVTNQGMRKVYQAACPGLQTPVHVIPPIASPAPEGVETPPARNIHLQLGYFGSFFPRIREPEPMLRFFERYLQTNRDWTLHLYGAIFENLFPVFERFSALKAHLQFHGMTGREDVIAAMRRMDALVMPGNTTSFQLPSKWADYIVSGRPVLHLVQTPEDPGLEWTQQIPWVLPYSLSEPGPLPDLDELRKRRPDPSLLAEWKQKFSPGEIAQAYADLLKG